MELNDKFYSKLVNIYDGLDNGSIQKINARLILLLINELKNESKIEEIFSAIEDYKKNKLR